MNPEGKKFKKTAHRHMVRGTKVFKRINALLAFADAGPKRQQWRSKVAGKLLRPNLRQENLLADEKKIEKDIAGLKEALRHIGVIQNLVIRIGKNTSSAGKYTLQLKEEIADNTRLLGQIARWKARHGE